jgi:hypothetical protein
VLISLLSVGPTAAATGLCIVGDIGSWQTGMSHAPGGLVRGTSALVDYYLEHLCNPSSGGASHSFSSSWVALRPKQALADVEDIYQVGYIRCQFAGCPSGARYVWAYGHGQGACGMPLAPQAVFGPSVSPFSTYYKISYRFASDLGQLVYEAYYSSTRIAWKPDEALETCWDQGPQQFQFHNEIGNSEDQVGGEVSPPEHWTSLKYANASNVWTSKSGICSLHQQPQAACGVVPAGIDTWDTRFP